MKLTFSIVLVLPLLLITFLTPCAAKTLPLSATEDFSDHVEEYDMALQLADQKTAQEPFEEEEEEEELEETISDPLEPINRVSFHFNDKLYFWLLKPVATGYKYVVPKFLRICVRNFFSNLMMPIRAVNCLLQGKVKAFGNELLRFTVNTTAGFAGFQDVAKDGMGVHNQDEDLDQTLGFYGLGPGFYINWPFFGPSSVRGTFGLVGDFFLYPVSYLDSTVSRIAINAGDGVNRTSLRIGDYEDLKEAALDPYVAVRDAYYQNRQSKIKD